MPDVRTHSMDTYSEVISYFMTPSQALSKDPPIPPTRKFRLGGMVVEGSVRRKSSQAKIMFTVTDNKATIEVEYTGMLPDLFSEGQSVVMEGFLENGRFRATEVLAKHDEKYIPKELADVIASKEAMLAERGLKTAKAHNRSVELLQEREQQQKQQQQRQQEAAAVELAGVEALLQKPQSVER